MKWIPKDSWPRYKWWVAGFGGAALWLGASNWMSYQNSMQLSESNRRVLQSYTIIQHLTTLYADVTVAESGRRGYIFLNDLVERDRYEAGVNRIRQELSQLQKQLAQDPEQSPKLRQMEQLIRDRIALLEQSIDLYQRDNNQLEEQRRLTLVSVELRDRIQQLLAEMKWLEEGRLRKGLERSQINLQTRFLLEAWWLVSVFGGLVMGIVLFKQQLKKRQAIESRNEKLLQLQELNALKLQFFSMASHEFRTPLSVILGSSQLLMTYHEQGAADKIEKNTLRIQNSAKSMTQLLSDILLLARADAGKLEYQCDRLELTSFCLNLVEDLQLAHGNHHVIQFSSRSTCQYANLDEKILYSVLSNLLLNAIKYSPEGKSVELSLSNDDRQIIFQVRDQGIGIEPEDQDQVFDVFYRGHNVRGISGSGVGLAVVKRCVDLMQGTIAVDSQVNVGSVFTVKLPIVSLG